VLLFGSAGHVLRTARLPVPSTVLLRLLEDTPDALFTPLFGAFARLCTRDISAQAGRALGLIGERVPHRDLQEMTEHLCLVDPPTLRRMAISAERHSAFELLGELAVPLLIVAGERDPFAPAESVGTVMRSACPNSELVCLPWATHTALLEQPESIRVLVDEFLERRLPEFLRGGRG
jgi:pimeloyl-ACP methyl ester carboxylesterase